MPKQEDGIRFERSTGTDRVLSSEVLTAFATNRREQISELDEQLRKYAQQIRALIPEALSAFASESHLAAIDTLMGLVATFGSANEHEPSSVISEKLKAPENYGFKDKKAAYEGMQALKRAWEGVLEVKVSRRDWYVEVWVRGIKQNA